MAWPGISIFELRLAQQRRRRLDRWRADCLVNSIVFGGLVLVEK
jgi:hypothetical protein